MKNINNRILVAFLTYILVFVSVSCKEFVEIDPPRTEAVRELVFNSDESATAAVDGIYIILAEPLSLLGGNLEVTTGLLSDELIEGRVTEPYISYEANEVLPNNTDVSNTFWALPYRAINNANAVIEGLSENNEVSFELRNHLIGEALFLRSLMHFYLTNLFGDIPLVTSTDIERNTNLSRTPQSAVDIQIVEDLERAEELMFEGYQVSNDNRVRANKHSATALLARVLLYVESWQDAETASTTVIDESGLYELEDLASVFTTSSREAILQLDGRGFFNNTDVSPLGDLFVLTGAPGDLQGIAALNPQTVALFDQNSARFNNWIGEFSSGGSTWNFSNKYKNHQFSIVGPPENTMVLRLAEQYLVRAEARAQQGNIDGAVADIDTLRARAGTTLLSDSIPGITPPQLLEFIGQERQRELFVEGGNRWFDLKRTGRADKVISVLKPTWESTDVLLPIPESEIERNANLLPQNPGF